MPIAKSAPLSHAPQTDEDILGIELGVREAGHTSAAGSKRPNRTSRMESASHATGRDVLSVESEGPVAVRGGTEQLLPGEDGERTDQTGAAASNVAEDPEEYRAIFASNPVLHEAWSTARAYREIFPDIDQAKAVSKLFPTQADAENAASELAELRRIDSLFVSNQSEGLIELAATVYRMNPQAFENLTRVMAGMIQATEPQRRREISSAEKGTAVIATDPRSTSTTAQQHPGHNGNNQAGFLQATNAMVVDGVMDSIKSQVERLLPGNISSGARNRVIGEVYRELDSVLRSNGSLARQLREAYHSGSFDWNHQQAVASLLVGRARQALPSVAKKVISEWTSSVLAASSERLARQRAGERRVDIANAGPAGSEARRPLSPRDVDYNRLSDADILNL
jgi:hypothetical protein